MEEFIGVPCGFAGALEKDLGSTMVLELCPKHLLFEPLKPKVHLNLSAKAKDKKPLSKTTPRCADDPEVLGRATEIYCQLHPSGDDDEDVLDETRTAWKMQAHVTLTFISGRPGAGNQQTQAVSTGSAKLPKLGAGQMSTTSSHK